MASSKLVIGFGPNAEALLHVENAGGDLGLAVVMEVADAQSPSAGR
jgi:hypothetical protein